MIQCNLFDSSQRPAAIINVRTVECKKVQTWLSEISRYCTSYTQSWNNIVLVWNVGAFWHSCFLTSFWLFSPFFFGTSKLPKLKHLVLLSNAHIVHKKNKKNQLLHLILLWQIINRWYVPESRLVNYTNYTELICLCSKIWTIY